MAERTATYVALFRGINVGKAKRLAMADLRALFADEGALDVATVLNSGNVVFRGTAAVAKAARFERAVAEQLGVSSRITVVSAAALAATVAANPLRKVATDPSKLLVGWLYDHSAATRAGVRTLAAEEWAPEAFVAGAGSQAGAGAEAAPGVVWMWCPAGVLGGRLWKSLDRELGDRVTARNWATVLKLHALATKVEGAGA